MKSLSFLSFIMAFICTCLTGASFASCKDNACKNASTQEAKATQKKKSVEVAQEESQDIIADETSDGEKFSDMEEEELSLDLEEDAE